MPAAAGAVSDGVEALLSPRGECPHLREAGRVRDRAGCTEPGPQPTQGQETPAATLGGDGLRVGAGRGAAEAGATGNRGAAGPARAGEGPVESRVRENLMHGSEGGRWKRGEGGIRDRSPWAPARKGGNRAAGCKSYHRVIPPPRQRPTLPACRACRLSLAAADMRNSSALRQAFHRRVYRGCPNP